MKVRFKESFARDLTAIKDKPLLARIRAVIENIEKAESLADAASLKRLHSTGACYRIRVGDYRVGLAVEEGVVVFVRALHHRDVYRYFP